MSITLQKKINKFLGEFSSSVIASSFGKTDMKYDTITGAIEKNKAGADVYFIVNPSTGMKDKDVTYLSTNFVDLDAGKNGSQYKTTKEVNAFKKRAISAVIKFPVQPTKIVETRNGYHVYWQYQPALAHYHPREIWRQNQNMIINYFSQFGANTIVSKPNQLMRVPGTYWFKSWAGKHEKFLTREVKYGCAKKYQSINNLFDRLSECNLSKNKPVTQKGYKASYSKYLDINKKSKINDSVFFDSADFDDRPLKSSNYTQKSATFNAPPWAKSAQNQTASDDSSFNKEELVEFLNDLSSLLYSKGMKFMAKQTKSWAGKLTYG